MCLYSYILCVYGVCGIIAITGYLAGSHSPERRVRVQKTDCVIERKDLLLSTDSTTTVQVYIRHKSTAVSNQKNLF